MFYIEVIYNWLNKQVAIIEETRELDWFLRNLVQDEDVISYKVLTIDEFKALNRCK